MPLVFKKNYIKGRYGVMVISKDSMRYSGTVMKKKNRKSSNKFKPVYLGKKWCLKGSGNVEYNYLEITNQKYWLGYHASETVCH